MLILLAFSLMIFVSCEVSNDMNPITSNSSKPIFFLLFEVNMNNGVKMVDVEFCTNNVTIIPTVTINRDTLKTTIDFNNGTIRGELHDLHYSKVYNYTITANRKKTSGNITMPTRPQNVKCNGIPLNDTQLNILTDSDSVKFSWTCDSYDYFSYKWESDYSHIKEATTKNTHFSFSRDGSVYYKLHLLAIEGPRLVPGVGPNVSGDYGDGYVQGLSEELEYNILISGGEMMRDNQNNSQTVQSE
ncbi:MAG: hypothetical protein JSW07_19070 [bacterium]|nr:MAG: hypothetical protein JSW07_19070 [bacterium]